MRLANAIFASAILHANKVSKSAPKYMFHPNVGLVSDILFPCNVFNHFAKLRETDQAHLGAMDSASRYMYGQTGKTDVLESFDTVALKNGTHQKLKQDCDPAAAHFLNPLTSWEDLARVLFAPTEKHLRDKVESLQQADANSREKKQLSWFEAIAPYMPGGKQRLQDISQALEESKDPVRQRKLADRQPGPFQRVLGKPSRTTSGSKRTSP